MEITQDPEKFLGTAGIEPVLEPVTGKLELLVLLVGAELGAAVELDQADVKVEGFGAAAFFLWEPSLLSEVLTSPSTSMPMSGCD